MKIFFVPIVVILLMMMGCASVPSPDARFTVASSICSDDFQTDSGQWKTELEKGGSVKADHGCLDIDVPAGATVWFKPRLKGRC
jgi:uncharacterized protein YceK